MSTACERLGYKVGDRFKVTNIEDSRGLTSDAVVYLVRDDGSDMPSFALNFDGEFTHWLHLYNVEKIAKEVGIEATLRERDNRYGSFDGHAKVTQGLKEVMKTGKQWESLSDEMKESLEMIQHKIGRILNGDPTYKDSWHDIIGYVKLIDDTLED